MKLLLDEMLPRKLAPELRGHWVRTAQQAGLRGLKDNQLLATAANDFDVLLTMDSNLEFQQNIRTVDISIVVIDAVDNKLETILPLVPQILQILNHLGRHELVHVGAR
jgi:predicted nuclease of predicted toxin-antitoxin system